MDKKKGQRGQKIFGDHSFIQRRAKVSSAEAMNQKKGKHGQKIFGEHSFIQRRAKFVKMWKTCEFRDFSVVCVKQIHHD